MPLSKYIYAPVFTAALVLSVEAHAQTAEPTAPVEVAEGGDSASEDIVVTALRRDTRLQDAPLSIVALNGAGLQQAGATQIADYFRQIPNLNLQQGGNGQARISIRGVSSSGDATVGLYYDETPVTGPSGTSQDSGATAADLNLFDVERVEALRGPQGTLYGSSSMAGTLRVIFKKPNLEKIEGAAEAEISQVEGGGFGHFVKGMANLPIATGVVAARVVGYREVRPGYIDNVVYDAKNVNRSTNWGLRGILGIKVDDRTEVTLTGIYQRSDADNQQGFYPAAGRYKSNLPVQTPFRSKMTLVNAKLDRELPFADLTVTGSYYKFDILRQFDSTPSVNSASQNATNCRTYFGQSTACSPTQAADFRAFGLSLMPAAARQPATLDSQTYEARLSSNRQTWLDWTVGAYYEKRRDRIDSRNYAVSRVDGAIPDDADPLTYRYVENNTRQLAGFGEVSIKPVDGLTITGGLRYYDYTRSTKGATPQGNPVVGITPGGFSKASADANGWLQKLNVDYKFTPDVMVYASASKGFRPGGANNIPGLPNGLVAYDADSLWNYEVGAKTSWFGGKLYLNAAVFQIDWSNIQINGRTLDGLYSFLTNAGAARIRGGELDLTYRPTRGLTVTASAGYSDGKLTQAQISDNITPTTSTGQPGDRIPGVPRWTAAASATYEFPLTDSLNGLVRADYAYSGNRTSTFRPTDAYFVATPGYSLLNLRVGVERENWGAYLFVRNATNSLAITSQSSSLGSARYTWTTPPRTFGASVRANF